MSPKRAESLSCNCRVSCPIEGKCRTENALYKCEASNNGKEEKTCIGVTKGEWKIRHRQHKTSFKHESHKNDTRLASHVWEMREKLDETPTLKWSIIKTAPTYNNRSKRCILCLNEKLAIATFSDEMNLLNKRSEMFQKCRHENAYSLDRYDDPGGT